MRRPVLAFVLVALSVAVPSPGEAQRPRRARIAPSLPSETPTEPPVRLSLRRGDGTVLDEAHDGVCAYAPSMAPAPSDPSADDPESLLRIEPADARAAIEALRVRVVDAQGAVRSEVAIDGERTLRLVPPDAPETRDAATVRRVVVLPLDTLEIRRDDAGASEPWTRIRVGGVRETGLRCAPRQVAVRVHVVRGDPGALAPTGATTAATRRTVDALLTHANGAFASCGLRLTPAESTPGVVDPPPPFVLAVAEGDGFPARGGTIRLRAGRRAIGPIDVPAGSRPIETARRVADELQAAGFRPRVVALPRLESAADAAADVLVLDAEGAAVPLSPEAGSPLTTDARQRLTIGRVDFGDGLDEYDFDRSLAGTLEERTLVYALADDDPDTIEVVLVQQFGRGSRLGESFVPRDGGPLRGTVILDRRGIAADPATSTLAHEVGHVLLDDPFHPAPSDGDAFRVMAEDSGRLDVRMRRSFPREECDRMRSHGASLLRTLSR